MATGDINDAIGGGAGLESARARGSLCSRVVKKAMKAVVHFEAQQRKEYIGDSRNGMGAINTFPWT